MCGHFENVSLRTASLYMRARSNCPADEGIVSNTLQPGMRYMSRSMIADATDSPGTCWWRRFSSVTRLLQTLSSLQCGSRRHTVAHWWHRCEVVIEHVQYCITLEQNLYKNAVSHIKRVSSTQNRWKPFTLYSLADLFNRRRSRLLREASSHATINAQWLFVHKHPSLPVFEEGQCLPSTIHCSQFSQCNK